MNLRTGPSHFAGPVLSSSARTTLRTSPEEVLRQGKGGEQPELEDLVVGFHDAGGSLSQSPAGANAARPTRFPWESALLE